ncbi:hypothetical protein LENED_000074 [Lentinula edodes]|uniref:Uncharacterized protein n=1 Tax=Lentinula edodes TaxID=5353 RepID=A0A1Q3DUL4_LENED|nr:hypothetical protein LENED_000074 [Lentinula edodes]
MLIQVFLREYTTRTLLVSVFLELFINRNWHTHPFCLTHDQENPGNSIGETGRRYFVFYPLYSTSFGN